MATKIARSKTIIDALTDATVTPAMATRIANAFAFTFAWNKPALTNEEKAGVFLFAVRAYVKQIVRDAEIGQAVETTRVATAPGAEIDIGTDGGV